MSKETKKPQKDTGLLVALKRWLKLSKDIATDSGQILTVEGEIEVGAAVFTTDENGDGIPAPDGTYTADGTTYTVAGGVITAIEATPEEEEEADPEEPEEKPEEKPDEEPEETDPEEKPEDETAQLKARVAELEAENAQLKEQLEEYKRKEQTALGKPMPEKDKEGENAEKTNLQQMLARVRK